MKQLFFLVKLTKLYSTEPTGISVLLCKPEMGFLYPSAGTCASASPQYAMLTMDLWSGTPPSRGKLARVRVWLLQV